MAEGKVQRKDPNHFRDGKPPAGKGDHPVTNVTLPDALAFANPFARSPVRLEAGETLFEASVDLACVDPRSLAPRRIPKVMLATLRAAQGPRGD